MFRPGRVSYEDSFAVNPPNATLSMFQDDHVLDAVVVLSEPRLKGNDLVYHVVFRRARYRPPPASAHCLSTPPCAGSPAEPVAEPPAESSADMIKNEASMK